MAERDRKGRFVTGHKKLSGAGRKKGTPNKATRAWKDFAEACSNDPELQGALRERCLARPDLLLRVAEHAVGKPRQSVEVSQQKMRMFIWPDDSDAD